MGGVEDDMHDEEEEEEDEKNEAIWGRNKNLYYGADNVDYEEEEEALRLQKKKAQSLLEAKFEQDESDSDSDKQQKLVTCMHGHLFCIFQYLNLLYVVVWRTARVGKPWFGGENHQTATKSRVCGLVKAVFGKFFLLHVI
ncbi:hypothetical protein Scep_013955 [Stephania cephalantha]|uniref:Uncharacterized protein n=1 Tax=Stephania cephalantha TaxID=152367 RepID=A0AAP0P057_9MAGN